MTKFSISISKISLHHSGAPPLRPKNRSTPGTQRPSYPASQRDLPEQLQRTSNRAIYEIDKAMKAVGKLIDKVGDCLDIVGEAMDNIAWSMDTAGRALAKTATTVDNRLNITNAPTDGIDRIADMVMRTDVAITTPNPSELITPSLPQPRSEMARMPFAIKPRINVPSPVGFKVDMPDEVGDFLKGFILFTVWGSFAFAAILVIATPGICFCALMQQANGEGTVKVSVGTIRINL